MYVTLGHVIGSRFRWYSAQELTNLKKTLALMVSVGAAGCVVAELVLASRLVVLPEGICRIVASADPSNPDGGVRVAGYMLRHPS
jgi:hypothetical protein